MPGITVPARRSRSSADDSELEPDQQSSSDESQGAPNKRPRLSDEDGRRDTRDSWRLDTPLTISRPVRPQPTPSRPQGNSGALTRGSSMRRRTPEHQPGAIIRISLTNFVTYSSASFHPGPALNMVIGPNGTGKSTLVCAICLGLGWSTQNLGRAKEVHEFVKHHCSEAIIEIELKGQPGKTNPVIKRQINRDNSSKWWLNGQPTNQKSVVALAKGFSIQIDNLCQFLPQDRVVEFAALNPVERLTQTIRATAPEYMVEQHEKLKSLRSEQKVLERDQANAKDNLTNLESRQNMQQADVERFRERERLLQEVELLEKLRPVAQMNTAKIRSDEAKHREAEGKEDLRRLKAEVEPSLRAVNAKQAYADKVKEVVDRRKTLFTGIERSAEECEKKRSALSAKVKECEGKREAERNSNKAGRKAIIDLQRKIQGIKLAMENAPPRFDAAEFNERKREKTREIREIQSRMHELEDESGSLEVELRQKTQSKAIAEKEAAALRSRIGQQMSILKSRYPDTYKAWDWIQQNQNNFESRVYGPAIVECSVNDKRFVKSIESLFQKSEFCAITCTSDNDLKFLATQLYDTMKLADLSLRNHTSPLSQYRPPIDDQEKQRLGIAGWAVDYLTGPEPVLAMLCAERCRLHSTAIIEKDGGDEQFQALEQSAVDNWVTLTTNYRVVRRREYNASSTVVNQVRDATVWTEQQVDVRHEGDLRDNIDGWESELAELGAKLSANKQEFEKLRGQEKSLKKEEAEIEKEKSDLQRKTSEFLALPNKLRTHESQLADHQATERQVLRRMEQIGEEETKYTLEKGQAAINYARIVDTLRAMHVQVVEAAIAYVEALSDVDTLKFRNEAVRELLERRHKEVKELTEDYKAKFAEAKRLTKEFHALMARNPDLGQRLSEMSEEEQQRTPEEIDGAIEGVNARLSLIHGASAGIIKEFEERGRKIERLKSSIAELEEKLKSLSASITEIRAVWEPELDALVDQISSAFGTSFETIRCAGEVVVDKAGEEGRDFESWAMIINVKFREEEQLSMLDSHRQSGGERAVSTIFYLMALQSLSRAPFRVVDEINQGMDPRNERIVHERMVDIACGMQDANSDEPQGSQYFLITPKLLTNLKYSPGMKVHCIASGPFMPTDPAKLDFKALVSRAKRLATNRSAATMDVSGLSEPPAVSVDSFS